MFSNYTSLNMIDDTLLVDISKFISITLIALTANLLLKNNLTAVLQHDVTFGAVSIFANGGGHFDIHMYMVKFSFYQCLGPLGGALYIFTEDRSSNIVVKECMFINNKSPGHGTILRVDVSYHTDVQIVSTTFDQNVAGESIIYVSQNALLH